MFHVSITTHLGHIPWAHYLFFLTINPPSNMPPIPSKYRRYNTYVNPGVGFSSKQLSILSRKLQKAKTNLKEKKHIVFNPASTSMSTGAGYLFNPLISIPQGTSVGSRIGTQIFLNKITFNMTISTPLVAAVDSSSRYHIYIYWSDAQTTGSSAAWSTITNATLQTSTPLLGSISSGAVAMQQLNTDQCIPVKDMYGVINAQTASVVNEKAFQFTLNFKNKKIQYLSDGTGSFNDGKNLYVLVVSDYSGGNATTPTNNGSVSCTYQVFFQE